MAKIRLCRTLLLDFICVDGTSAAGSQQRSQALISQRF
jgi:hypothetical protein